MGGFASKVAAAAAVARAAMAAVVRAAAMTAVAKAAMAAVAGAAAGWSFPSNDDFGAGSTPWSTAFHQGNKAKREAADAVFEAITKAQVAAECYMFALFSSAASAAAKAYGAVKRAAADVRRRIVELIQRCYGSAAATWAKMKLDGVNEPIGVGEVSV